MSSFKYHQFLPIMFNTSFQSDFSTFEGQNQSAIGDNQSAQCSSIGPCPEYDQNEWVYFTIVYFGSICSVISFFENLLLFFAIMIHESRLRTYFVFLLIMAASDTVLSATYIPLIVIDQVKDRLIDADWLNMLWMSYFREMLTVCNFCLTASAYVLMACQLERFLIMTNRYKNYVTVRGRWLLCALAVGVAAVMKIPVFYELTVEANENCSDHIELMVGPSDLTKSEYYALYALYARNLLCVLVPFVTMTFFNIRIVVKLRKAHRRAQLFHFITNEHKSKVRSATRTFVLITCTYLASNLLNIIIYFWEHADIQSLLTTHCYFHKVSTDLVTLLTIIAIGLRLPIYLLCNTELRKVLYTAVIRIHVAVVKCKFKLPPDYIENLQHNIITRSQTQKLPVLRTLTQSLTTQSIISQHPRNQSPVLNRRSNGAIIDDDTYANSILLIPKRLPSIVQTSSFDRIVLAIALLHGFPPDRQPDFQIAANFDASYETENLSAIARRSSEASQRMRRLLYRRPTNHQQLCQTDF